MTLIRQMTYEPRGGAATSVEVMSFARLRELDRGSSERGDFFVVALIESGHGSVAIDFEERPLDARSIVWLGPGVVHRWVEISSIEGMLVLFTPTAPVAPSARVLSTMPGIGATWTVERGEWELLQGALAHLRSEFEATLRDPSSPPEILGSLLSAFILRGSPTDQLVAAGNEIFQQFRTAVESGLGNRHDVEHYARLLGYSARTLSRSARSTTGQSAKAYVTERVILEAKRLMVHENRSLRDVAQRLGFSDSSVFSAYFRRETGTTPGAWRDRFQ